MLSRLNKVKSKGRDSWMCECPAHQDKSPSLKIDLKNGKILIKCWSGCDTESILNAIGLDFSDILPDSPQFHRSKGTEPTIYATDALRVLKHEAQIIVLGAIYIKNNKPISDDDLSSLLEAMKRINYVMDASGVKL
jgi:hypothetical protein